MWWWLLPHGFPIAHSRFFLHVAMPAMVIAASAGAVTALWTDHPRIAAALLATLPSALVGAAIAAAALYPTARIVAAAGLLPGMIGATAVLFSFRTRKAALACGALLGLFDGAVWARAWRADLPSTHPAGVPALASELVAGGSLLLYPHEHTLYVQPAMVFRSCSPDRFLTVLVWPPQCPSVDASIVSASDADGSTRVVAMTRLDEDVYSHLNTFTTIDVAGNAGTPFLTFSPAPDSRIEVVAGEYPFGAPYRLAYVGDDGMFRIVEASSGEKGPFRELAAGPLRRGEPLTITLWDGDLALADLTFEDFTAQASTELSPTAGWGLPQNAIQFTREGTSASIVLTLASTSIGRGFDSVGHRAGTYRNRVRVAPR